VSQEQPRHASSSERKPRHTVAYYCAAAVLLIGLVAASLVYVLASDDGEADAAAEIASARIYQHNLEVMGGKFAVHLDEFDRWFASLWHGRALARTIALLALALAVVCVWVGDLMSRRRDDS
jgi:ABC-type Fe3+ transport system permease subunit